MNEIDITDDDNLRFIQRVLESNAPEQDRRAARNMVVEIRTRIRKVHIAVAARIVDLPFQLRAPGVETDEAPSSMLPYCDKNIAAWEAQGNAEMVEWWKAWRTEVVRREAAATRGVKGPGDA